MKYTEQKVAKYEEGSREWLQPVRKDKKESK